MNEFPPLPLTSPFTSEPRLVERPFSPSLSVSAGWNVAAGFFCTIGSDCKLLFRGSRLGSDGTVVSFVVYRQVYHCEPGMSDVEM